jgi:NAD(P)-dependent dehydrogenase (short-subunit alcohol dehydrogenase family)
MPSVLVTGAGRGIGLAITEHMSRQGWDVYATARSDAALHSLDRMPNVHAIPLDITDRSAIAALPDRLPASLNGVANNAGIIVNGPVEGLSLDDLTQQFDVNVISQIAVTQAVLPKIRSTRGRVVFMSSRQATFSAHTASPPPQSQTPAGPRASSRHASIAPRTTSARGPRA